MNDARDGKAVDRIARSTFHLSLEEMLAVALEDEGSPPDEATAHHLHACEECRSAVESLREAQVLQEGSTGQVGALVVLGRAYPLLTTTEVGLFQVEGLKVTRLFELRGESPSVALPPLLFDVPRGAFVVALSDLVDQRVTFAEFDPGEAPARLAAAPALLETKRPAPSPELWLALRSATGPEVSFLGDFLDNAFVHLHASNSEA